MTDAQFDLSTDPIPRKWMKVWNIGWFCGLIISLLVVSSLFVACLILKAPHFLCGFYLLIAILSGVFLGRHVRKLHENKRHLDSIWG